LKYLPIFKLCIPEKVTVPIKIDFRQIVVNDTHVVWLAEANRFVQFKEPAFFVFEQWAIGVAIDSIAISCTVKYGLPPPEAERFAGEIIGETEKLFDGDGSQEEESQNRNIAKSQSRPVAESQSRKVAKSQSRLTTCTILNKTLLFNYETVELENLFRPMFKQFEVEVEVEVEVEKMDSLDFFLSDGNYVFRVNDREPQIFGMDDAEHFQGAVLLDILNILHNKTKEDWMAVFHASAVSFGEKALLFTADSGGGKSTLAALLVTNGGKLISDDFVPVSLDDPKVFPLPSALSVKKGALPVLKDFFPELRQLQEEWDGESELFLPFPEERTEGSPVRAQAIVFVRYDPSAGFSLTRESNLEMMNALLKQSWIPGNAEAAGGFLAWYFSLPVYSLTYSDSEKMSEEIKPIFDV